MSHSMSHSQSFTIWLLDSCRTGSVRAGTSDTLLAPPPYHHGTPDKTLCQIGCDHNNKNKQTRGELDKSSAMVPLKEKQPHWTGGFLLLSEGQMQMFIKKTMGLFVSSNFPFITVLCYDDTRVSARLLDGKSESESRVRCPRMWRVITHKAALNAAKHFRLFSLPLSLCVCESFANRASSFPAVVMGRGSSSTVSQKKGIEPRAKIDTL